MKRWIAFLLSFVMVLSLMPMAVMAEEAVEGPPITALYVGTVNALETPSGDGWSFNRETGVLTLNNCTLTESMLHVETDEYGSDRFDAMIYVKGDLTIELIGTNSVERVIEEAPTVETNYYAICNSIYYSGDCDRPGSLTFTGSGNLTVGIAVTRDCLSEDEWNMSEAWDCFSYSSGIGSWSYTDLSGLYGGGWMDIYGGIYGVEAPYNVRAFANYPTFGDNCIVTAYRDVEGTVENENGYNWSNNDAWRMKVVTGDAYLMPNGQLILLDNGSASGEGWTWGNSVLTLSENTEVKAVEFRRTVGSAKVTLAGDVTLDATDMGYDANWNSISAVTAYCDLEIDAGDHTLTLHNSWADALRAELCDVTLSGGTVVTTNEGGYAMNMIGGDLTVQNATFRSATEIYLTEGYDADYNTIPAGDAVLDGAVVVLDSPITSYGTLTILSSDVTVTGGYDALYGSNAVTVRDSTLSINATGHALTSDGVVTVDNCNLNLTAEEAVIYHGYYHYEWNDESSIPDTACVLLQNMDITQPENWSVQQKQTDSDYYTKYEVLVVDGDGNPATTLVATAAGNEHEHSYENGICSCGAKQTFTITWKNADGTVLEVDTVEYGVIPEYNGPTPTKEVTGQTCTFVGWGTVVAATADKTYTASFYQTYNKHDVILMDGDTELGRYEVTYNVIVSESKLPEYAGNPTKPCCTIAGWQYADGAAYSSTRMPDEDMVLYIVWDGPNHSYEAVVTAPGCGTGGYTTHTCSGCGDSYVSDETEPLGEHSYVDGICSNCGAKQTFTVTWYNWDGTVLEVDTVQYGETPEYNGPTPTRTGVGYDYTFYAWGYNSSGSQTGTPGPAANDQHWYAKFTSTVHKHDLIFMDGDLELARKEFDYNKYIYASGLNTYAGNHFAKDCCTHTGWAYADGTSVSSFWMPDEDLVVYAVWDGPNHTLVDGTCSVCGLTEGVPEHTHFFVEGSCACGKVQTFTVAWTNWDGTVLEVDTVEYGQIPEYNGETPIKTDVGYDYTFSCWHQGNYPATFEAVTENLTFKAYYTSVVHKHDLIFMDGDLELARKEFDYNKYIYASGLNTYAGNPTKACYTLSGWAYADGTVAGAFWMPDEDVVLYAVWDGPNHSWVDATCAAPKTCSGCGLTEGEALEHTYTEGVCSGCGAKQTFTVTWANWDGTVLETDTVEYGTVPTYDGETPTRPNVGWDYKFYGWGLSASGAEVTPGAATKDVTYYAKYTSTVHKHDLIFMDDDGVTELGRYETNYSKYISAGWLSTAAGNPTKEGYTLTGWTYADGSAVESFYMPDEDVIFVAVWEPTQYTLHFDANEGSFEPYSAVPQKDSIYTIGDTVTLPKAYRTGYTLLGYKFYTDSAYSVEYTGPIGTMPAQELWAVAQWEINFYDITFYPEGGSFVDGTTGFKYEQYEYNTPFIDQLPEIFRDCYTFQGWKLYTTAAKDFAYTGSTEAMPAQNLHAVAQWSGPNHMDAATDADHSCDTCGAENVTEHSYTAVVTAPTCTEGGYTTYTCNCGDSYVADETAATGHSYSEQRTEATCTEPGLIEYTCANCGDVYTEEIPATGHSYMDVQTPPTCTEAGYTTHTCHCGDSYVDNAVAALGHNQTTQTIYPTCTEDGTVTVSCDRCGEVVIGTVPATGHSYENGTCTTCGAADPDAITIPTLTLKAPTLEFKDMITVNAMFTAEHIEDVVEMGMITYSSQVTEWSVDTAEHIIPGTKYDADTGRYIAASQGIHAKYLGDTVYLACYAKLTDGSYVYSKLAGYSPVQYATSKLNGTDVALKQLVAAMLNYGAAAQTHFQHNVENLANATLTAEQIALPEAYRDDMVGTVPAADEAKQGIFYNNKGFAKRYPAISFEGAFCINYFFNPNYTPVDGITLYYWNEADFVAADVLTKENASGTLELFMDDGLYRGDITGIAAKDLSGAIYVAAVYSDGTTEWTSGVLGYSIGAYCSSMAKGTDAMADLAMATAVYGYHAKQYFGS